VTDPIGGFSFSLGSSSFLDDDLASISTTTACTTDLQSVHATQAVWSKGGRRDFYRYPPPLLTSLRHLVDHQVRRSLIGRGLIKATHSSTTEPKTYVFHDFDNLEILLLGTSYRTNLSLVPPMTFALKCSETKSVTITGNGPSPSRVYLQKY